MEQSLFDKALRVFNDKGIKSKPLCNYGLWVISEGGDIVSLDNTNGHYCIGSCQVFEDDWIEHLCEKTWFSEQDKENVIKALNTARNIVKPQ